MERVAAVVVTFNRLAKLPRVLASIEAQDRKPDLLVIIDNASTDGTMEWLDGFSSSIEFEVRHLKKNTGGAGGFAAGMDLAYGLGADFSWIMDDDCYPESSALSELLQGLRKAEIEAGTPIPFACSVVNFIDGNICEMNNPETTWDWGRLRARGQDAVLVKSCSFVSVLIPRWAVHEFGLPYSEYFIWYDDHEYTLRLSSRTPGVQVMTSVVIHDMGRNEGVNFGLIDSNNAWKFAYGIRNEASFHLHHESVPAYLLFVARVAYGMRRGGVAQRLRRRMYGQLIKAVAFNPKIRYPTSSPRGMRASALRP